MDFLELVKNRYSCRAYKSLSVETGRNSESHLSSLEDGRVVTDGGIAKEKEPAVVIPLGYAADEPKEKKRKPIEDIIK